MVNRHQVNVGIWVLETSLLGAIFYYVAAGLLGQSDVGASLPAWVRVVVLVLLVVFVVVPVWVWRDVRRTGGDDRWVRLTLFPLVNLLGLAAYLRHRRRDRTDAGAGE